jgi:GR25 family glycosyltransferase involved in LPS biosynthesis
MEAYIIHYTPLNDRKVHIQKECDHAGITPIYVEAHDREVLTDEQKAKFEGLRLASVSLILKHVEAWRLIAKGTRPWGLIFEDDAILCDEFMTRFTEYMSETPEDFDVVMINEGCNMHIPSDYIEPDKHIYLRGTHVSIYCGNGGTRCLDGYVITKSCAEKFVSLFDNYPTKITLTSDWLTNVFMREIDAVVYWAEPNLVSQGTETGLFANSYE